MTNKEFEDLTYQEKIKYNLPAIIAFANGGAIESTSLCTNEYFDVYTLNYIHKFPHRIKPKTVKKWFNIYLDNLDTNKLSGYGYSSKDIADKVACERRFTCLEIEVPVVAEI